MLITNQYEQYIAHILSTGATKTDRTGTGTLSVFGHQMRFDLRNGFPLITTKKVHFKSIAIELLWFLRGITNVRWLQQRGVSIWDEWAREDGELGPVYGHAWRRWGEKPVAVRVRAPKLRPGLQPTYLGVGSGAGKEGNPLAKTWEGMMARCYDPQSVSYQDYGARGVHVCDRWLEFAAFSEDAEMLPGWIAKQFDSETRYVLDKDKRGGGFLYSPETCCWITDSENQRLREQFIYTLERDGELHRFTNISEFCEEQGISNANISDLWTGRKGAKLRHGFSFVSREPLRKPIDQIQRVIEGIRKDPHGRRHIVTAWNPQDIDDAALPPCHCLFQFYVADGKLSCQLYQRSCDSFLGVPFNIASYALLTHLVAHQCDLEVGDFIWTGGDCHIYSNHIEQATEITRRAPRQFPRLVIKRKPDSIDGYEFEDFEIVGYDPHPAIKAPIAV